MVIRKLFALGEARLVVAPDVGEVDTQPPVTRLAQRLGIGKLEQATAQIIANVIQVRRNRIRPAAEIHIVGEIKALIQETVGNFELVVDVTALRMVGRTQ